MLPEDSPQEKTAGFEVKPAENVYSYIMFIVPIEHKLKGRVFTWDTIMGVVLVVANFVMQGYILSNISEQVIMMNIKWQDTIYDDLGEIDAEDLHLAGPSERCLKGNHLCFDVKGVISCAPPAVQLSGKWDDLDTNGDGSWSLEEVQASAEKLKCKYNAADPVEMFDSFRELLIKSEDKIWIHPDIKAGKAIPKPYFTYAMGDIALCSSRDPDMCATLLLRGVFDKALEHGNADRVGTTINSALNYCNSLLKSGGVCERVLPSIYSVWKEASVMQCGDPLYKEATYTHPKTGRKKSVLMVDYMSRVQYNNGKTLSFQIFKTINIALWLLVMLGEFRGIIVIFTWCARFPSDKECGENTVVLVSTPRDASERYMIQGITTPHRVSMIILNIGRLCIACTLVTTGCSFLLRETHYIKLILEGIALVFIVEISQFLYAMLLRPQIKEKCENFDSMYVPMYGIPWLNARQAIYDLAAFIGLLVAAMVVVWIYEGWVVVPLEDALECACLGSGKNCYEATRFSKGFWDEYWGTKVPAMNAEIDRMHASAGSSLVELNAELGATRSSAQASTEARRHVGYRLLHAVRARYGKLGSARFNETAGMRAEPRHHHHGHRHHRPEQLVLEAD